MDKRILNPNGDRYPFKVSDEYFDNLTARIMKQIDSEASTATPPEEAGAGEKWLSIHQHRRKTLWISVLSMAASLAILAVIALKVFPTSTTSGPQIDQMTAEYTDDDYNEELMSYTMADNMAVYDYLSGDYTE